MYNTVRGRHTSITVHILRPQRDSTPLVGNCPSFLAEDMRNDGEGNRLPNHLDWVDLLRGKKVGVTAALTGWYSQKSSARVRV